MQKAESPLKYQPSYEKLNPYQSTQAESLPKLSILSPSRPNRNESFQLNARNTPMKRSYSMSSVLHGDNQLQSSHFVDSLQRFKRNHDAVNKEQRERQKQTEMNKLMQRRMLQINREEEHRKRQQQNLRQLIQKNSRILEGHRQGIIRNDTYNNSLPINPITKKYDNNIRGQNQKHIDNEQKARKLIRGHRMELMGNSGYNLINGTPIDNTSKLVEKDVEGMYKEKLEKMNQKYKLRPQSLEEFERFSSSKIFRYH